MRKFWGVGGLEWSLLWQCLKVVKGDMGWKRIEIRLIPTLILWILPFFFSFMFFAELIKKAVKIKKRKCFLNSNDFEDQNVHSSCFNGYSEKERKTFLPLKNCLTVMIIWCKRFYHLSSLRLLDVYIKLRYWLMPEVVLSDLYYNC